MSFRTPRSPISKRPWKRSSDCIGDDNRYPKYQPYFKRPKVDGVQKFPERRERSPLRFSDAKTCRRLTVSHVGIAPLKPLNNGSRNYDAPRRECNSDGTLAFKDKSNDVVADGVAALKHGGVSKSSSQQSLSPSMGRRPSKGQEKVSFHQGICLRDVDSRKSRVEPKPSIGTGHDRSVENGVQIRAMAGLKERKNIHQENAPKRPANYNGDAFHAPHSRFNDSGRRLDGFATGVPLKHGAISSEKLKSSSQQSLSPSLERLPSKGQEKVSFHRGIRLQDVDSWKSQVEPSIGTGHDRSVENGVPVRAMDGLKEQKNIHQENAPERPANYKGDAFHAHSRFNDSGRRLDGVAIGVPLKHGAVSSKKSQHSMSHSLERQPSNGQEKVSFHQGISLQDVDSQKSRVEPKPSIGTGHDLSVENYKGDAFHAPHSRFNDSDRRLAFKATSNDVVAIGVPLKHGAVSGKLKSSSPLLERQERLPSKGQEKVSFPQDISLQEVVSQNSQVEPKPSIGTGDYTSVEHEVQIRAMAGLKVPKNVLQPANYKGDAFQDFSYCHAFKPEISEIKSQDSDEAKAFGSSGIAAGPIKSAASKNLNCKLGRKVDDSGQNMTSEAKLDGVAEHRIRLRQVSALDTLRPSSQEDVSSSPIYAPQGGACVKQEFNVEQKTPIEVTSAHSIENGAHGRSMKVPKDIVMENSHKFHAHSGDLVNQKSNVTTLKNTVEVASHDQIIQVTTEVKVTVNVQKNMSEVNSSICQREPNSVLNGESCKMDSVENTVGSKPQAEKDKASFSFLGKYSGQKPNLEPLDLRHQDDEKMVRSLEKRRKGKIAEEMNAIDLESSLVDNGTAEQLSRQVTDCEAIPGNCGYQEKMGFQHLFSDKIVVVNMQGEARVSEKTFNNDGQGCCYYVTDRGVADDHIQKLEQLKDCIVLISDRYHAHDSRKRVIRVLELFKDVYTVRMRAYKAEQNRGNAIQKIDIRTAMALKYEQKWVNYERVFVGHVPGVYIGDQFRFRAELAIVGLHRTFCSGIHYVEIQGKNYAISIVDSGRYQNQSISPNSFIYVGHGGNPSIAGKEPRDQKLKYGNLALKNSRDKGVPVRVIRACHVQHECSTSNKRYIYEGLFVVTRYWQERGQYGKMAFMFELHRMSGQPSHTHQMSIRPKNVGGWYHRQALKKGRPFLNGNRSCGVFKSSLKKSTKRCQALERVLIADVSQGKENLPIRIVSDIYAERPPPFTYTVNMIYPDWYHPTLLLGCDCTDGCSDSRYCFCAFRNGGEIPYNSHGAIIKPKPVIYECGPTCKCPPSCRNRVSQCGLRYHLEIFRKKPSGWGVRSRDYISTGSFICEFIGELLDKKEAEKRIGHSEYLFHIATPDNSCTDARLAESSSCQGKDDNGYRIDAAHLGNVARFINGSSSPNLYVQHVLYDDDYEDVPHIMLFAGKNITPMQEFTLSL